MLRARRHSSASRTLRNTTKPNPFDWCVARSVQRLNSSRSPYVTPPSHAHESTELPLHLVARHVVWRPAEEEAALLQRLATVARAPRVAAATLTLFVTTALTLFVTTALTLFVVAASARLAVITWIVTVMRVVTVVTVVGLVAAVRVLTVALRVALRVALATMHERILYMNMGEEDVPSSLLSIDTETVCPERVMLASSAREADSASSISTYPYPLDSPVARSITTFTSRTWPNAFIRSSRSSLVTYGGSWLTHSILSSGTFEASLKMSRYIELWSNELKQ